MRAQLALRRGRLEAGDAALGWKLGFGSPGALEKLGTSGPLSGFLLRSALVASGGTVSVAGWTAPVAEPEVAVHLGRDLAPGAGRGEAAAAIAGVGPAVEVADVDRPPDDVEAILAGNVYQRAVVLGPVRAWPGGLRGLEATVLRDGSEVARTGDPEALTGDTLDLLVHLAALLGAFGEALSMGDVVITGSVVPPLAVEAPEELALRLVRDLAAVRLAA